MSHQPQITARIAAELLRHEGIVPEAYRDSQGVWTWGVGVTDASGHRVGRYRDNPQSLARCLEIYLWLLSTRYLPPVLAAFGDYPLAEHELGAALSFHWNTGAAPRASWVKLVKRGEGEAAKRAIMDWCRPPSLRPRREAESALFFDGHWSGDGTALLYKVAKPSYHPVRPTRVEVMNDLTALLGPAKSVTAAASPPEPAARARNWFERLFGSYTNPI